MTEFSFLCELSLKYKLFKHFFQTFPHHLPFTLILVAKLACVSEHAASAVIVFGVTAFV